MMKPGQPGRGVYEWVSADPRYGGGTVAGGGSLRNGQRGIQPIGGGGASAGGMGGGGIGNGMGGFRPLPSAPVSTYGGTTPNAGGGSGSFADLFGNLAGMAGGNMGGAAGGGGSAAPAGGMMRHAPTGPTQSHALGGGPLLGGGNRNVTPQFGGNNPLMGGWASQMNAGNGYGPGVPYGNAPKDPSAGGIAADSIGPATYHPPAPTGYMGGGASLGNSARGGYFGGAPPIATSAGSLASMAGPTSLGPSSAAPAQGGGSVVGGGQVGNQLQNYTDQTNAANQQRYQQLLQMAGQLSDVGLQREQIRQQDMLGRADQNLTSAGLGNTTVKTSVERGVVDDSALRQQMVADQGLKAAMGIIERRTDQPPDYALLASLASRAGASSGASPLGYGGAAGYGGGGGGWAMGAPSYNGNVGSGAGGGGMGFGGLNPPGYGSSGGFGGNPSNTGAQGFGGGGGGNYDPANNGVTGNNLDQLLAALAGMRGMGGGGNPASADAGYVDGW